MNVKRKYTAIQINEKRVDDNVIPSLKYGTKRYSDDYIETLFDTEEEALEYAYKYNKYATWLIVPIISFNWIDDETENKL